MLHPNPAHRHSDTVVLESVDRQECEQADKSSLMPLQYGLLGLAEDMLLLLRCSTSLFPLKSGARSRALRGFTLATYKLTAEQLQTHYDQTQSTRAAMRRSDNIGRSGDRVERSSSDVSPAT